MIAQQTGKEVIIVTGSSGFIGTQVIEALRTTYQIVGFDRDGQPQPPPEVECVCVDLTDDSSVRRGLKRVQYAYGNRIASVIHLAAYYNFSGEPSDLYDKVTVKGTQRLLRELQRQQFSVEQFVFSSTMLVHKPTSPGKPITEDSPVEGRWDYPESKIKTEALLRQEHGDIPIVLLRIAGVYSDACNSIPISHQIQRIHEHKLTSHLYPGEVLHGQSFVHIDDLVRAIAKTIEVRRTLGSEEVFLIGEPETYSYDRLQHELARLLHGEKEWETHEIPKSLARTGAWVQNQIPGIEEPFIKPWMVDLADDHYELDISRAREKLGWEPKRRLIDTLPRMVEQLKADPVAWYRRHKMDPPSDVEKSAKEHERKSPVTAR